MPDISILFGLGNPGQRYRNTRHNLGHMAIDLVASRYRLAWEGGSGRDLECRWALESRDLLMLKSSSYMNLSGESLARFGDLDPSQLLVICDDLSLPLGRMRIRRRGGSGGHLGLESIITSLGTDGFARLRLGIGSPPPSIEWSEFVLLPFLEEERPRVEEMLVMAADALETVVTEGIDEAMQRYNRRAED